MENNENNLSEVSEIVIEESMIPTRNPAVTIREEIEEDGKYVLFNTDNEFILLLNSTGKFIFDNCDGKKSVAQLVGDIKSSFIVGEDLDLPSVVKEFIGILVKARLVLL